MIADRPLTDIVPLQLADAGTGEDGQKVYRTVTQYSMKPVEEIGLLKMDFLGLRNLDVIEDALDIVERSTGSRPDMSTLPLDDEQTYETERPVLDEAPGPRDTLSELSPPHFAPQTRPGTEDEVDLDAFVEGKPRPDHLEE